MKKFGRNLKWIIHGAMVKEVKNGRKRRIQSLVEQKLNEEKKETSYSIQEMKKRKIRQRSVYSREKRLEKFLEEKRKKWRKGGVKKSKES